jgi:hypothetical protein
VSSKKKNSDEQVRGDKQKAAGNKEKSPKVKKESSKKERRVKKARTHSERFPEREGPQVEAKKEIKVMKWIMK